VEQSPGATFAQRLRAYRLSAGLNQAALAWQSGVAETSIRQYEQGRAEPGPQELAGLARVLGPELAAEAPPPARAQ
jgi:transcriptional regulator with XRE-family HTH domain